MMSAEKADVIPSNPSHIGSGRLWGKVAIVTGAASGFGKAIAERFAFEGAKVVVADLNGEGAEQLASALRARRAEAVSCAVNVAEGSSFQAMVDLTVQKFGQIHIIVNNAGVAQRHGDSSLLAEAEYDRLFDVNMKSLYWCVTAAVPVLERTGGVILNTTSISAIRPRPGTAWYCASKGAANVATKALAAELAPRNIRVCALAPVAANTPLLADALSVHGGEVEQARVRQSWASTIPLGRLCESEDMANAALFLASDEASYLTGVCLEVDGGKSI